MTFIIELKGLTVAFKGSPPTIKDMDMKIERGEHIGIMGRSGSGKSTLLNVLCGLVPSRLRSELKGRVNVCGLKAPDIWMGAPGRIGVVFQAPDEMFVMDTVIDEMAFSLYSMGMDRDEALTKCMKVASSLGVGKVLRRRTRDLSGGEKQLVAIASQLVTRPQLLLLDEPSSQLDPSGKERLRRALGALRRDMPGLTVVQVEQDLGQLVDLDRVLVLDGGRILIDGRPEEVLLSRDLLSKAGLDPHPDHAIISAAVEAKLVEHVTERLRGMPCKLWEAMAGCGIKVRPPTPHNNRAIRELVLKGLSFRYPGTPTVLKGLDLDLSGSRSVALIGRNGAGKSTLGKLISGLLVPDSGSLTVKGERFYLFQRPINMFFSRTVGSEVRGLKGSDGYLRDLGLDRTKGRDPALLSEGERQRLGLVLALSSGADILVLDEPLKALDGPMRDRALRLLDRAGSGAHIIITNDPATAARCERVVVILKGRVAADGPPDRVLCDPAVMTALGWPLPSACVISRRAGLDNVSDPLRLEAAVREVGR